MCIRVKRPAIATHWLLLQPPPQRRGSNSGTSTHVTNTHHDLAHRAPAPTYPQQCRHCYMWHGSCTIYVMIACTNLVLCCPAGRHVQTLKLSSGSTSSTTLLTNACNYVETQFGARHRASGQSTDHTPKHSASSPSASAHRLQLQRWSRVVCSGMPHLIHGRRMCISRVPHEKRDPNTVPTNHTATHRSLGCLRHPKGTH